MTRHFSKFLPLALLAGFGALSASPVTAQDSVVSTAKAAGQVGEQADGYIGIKGAVSDAVRGAVDAINIKRRAAYTDLAAKRGVTVADMAAITGCQTLSMRVSQGQIYRIGTGDWQVKGPGPITLPDYCAKSAN